MKIIESIIFEKIPYYWRHRYFSCKECNTEIVKLCHLTAHIDGYYHFEEFGFSTRDFELLEGGRVIYQCHMCETKFTDVHLYEVLGEIKVHESLLIFEDETN